MDDPAVQPDIETVHGSCVALAGRALLIRGASGQGKSALALDLLSRGAMLISDDRTILRRKKAQIIASAPEAIAGRIEARGVGILHVPAAEPAPLVAIVDLDTPETERLPPERSTKLLGVTLPLVRNSEMTCFPAALILYVTHGRFA